MARSHFTFLDDCTARTDVILGDARLLMEREEPQQFDVLVLDAFTSDAIPVHPLTREAFEIYRRHLKPDGIIAVHISNRYLDLKPMVLLLAEHFKHHSTCVYHVEKDDDRRETLGVLTSKWVLLTNDKEFLQFKPIRDATQATVGNIHRVKLWSGEESNLFKLLAF